LVAFGLLFPNLELMIMFIPVPVKAKYIIPVYIIFEIVSSAGVLGSDNVAHLAHLGGALIAFILIKIWGIKRTDNYY
jgi:membrane associated rhomboid family serine protease